MSLGEDTHTCTHAYPNESDFKNQAHSYGQSAPGLKIKEHVVPKFYIVMINNLWPTDT